ncbi:MAG: alpha-glucan family phosphorylase [Acidimicrobiales bacterium]
MDGDRHQAGAQVAPVRLTSGAEIAFFSMEVALDDALPTFAGGLGVLAGDFLRSAADLALPVVGVTLMYRHGYFIQHLDTSGRQSESPVSWSPQDVLEPLSERVSLEMSGRVVNVRAWRRLIRGQSGAKVPLYLLDTDLAENAAGDRAITDQLYAGGQEHRLHQEVVLGLGGLAMLSALGYEPVTFHMNEGHCSLLTLGLMEALLAPGSAPSEKDIDAVRHRCAFTTHTPVPAGHDRFPERLVRSVLGPRRSELLSQVGALTNGSLNMTDLGMRLSDFTNGVSLRHGEVSRTTFPEVGVRSITNGIHADSWAGAALQRLFDRDLPGWRAQNDLLRYATGIDLADLEEAHRECKTELIDTVQRSTGLALEPDALTIGLARRATPYKRTALLFSNLERLRALVETYGPLQVVCSGKAPPGDEGGKALIAEIVAAGERLRGVVKVVFLEGYSLSLAKVLCAGSDVWLNTPAKPNEASGTSGMKAALNGVPSLSILDGWWIEGCIEGITGWAIGDHTTDGDDASALYNKLEQVVAPLFYRDRHAFLVIMRNAIALNGSFFNTERMVREYSLSAYGLTANDHTCSPVGA